jgi:hypothetical protein
MKAESKSEIFRWLYQTVSMPIIWGFAYLLKNDTIHVTIDVRYWGITTSYLSVIITSYKTQGHQGSRVWESQTEPVMYTHLYCLCSLWFL